MQTSIGQAQVSDSCSNEPQSTHHHTMEPNNRLLQGISDITNSLDPNRMLLVSPCMPSIFPSETAGEGRRGFAPPLFCWLRVEPGFVLRTVSIFIWLRKPWLHIPR